MVDLAVDCNDVTEIHTSSRNAFRRCRRKWLLGTLLNLTSLGDTNFHLWFGTGFHFALEDYYGYRRFKEPIDAFKAYYKSFMREQLPPEAEESIELAEGMLDHYLNYWIPQRGNEYRTFHVDGEPQVEVDFTFTLPKLSEKLGVEVKYKGTFDRVVLDSDNNIWIQDYKTATNIDTDKLETDPQISTYKWAAESWYGQPVEGVLYTQFKKKYPEAPRVLKSGNLSVDKRQNTTYALYKKELMLRYPEGNYPKKYIDMLSALAERETPEGDDYIRQDTVYRNENQGISEYKQMCQEIEDMYLAITDDRLYKNATRNCSWDCDFKTVCIAMDDGGDYQHLIDTMYEVQSRKGREFWREKVDQIKEGYDGQKI